MYVNGIKGLKANLRTKFRNIRENLNAAEKLKMDNSICNRVMGLKEYKRQKLIFTYVSKKIEVDTFSFILKTLCENKKVAVPMCITDTHEMDFYIINSFDDLSPGTFGVLEPNPKKCQKVTNLTHGFCIVPGFSFDRSGYRLGYGQGYYDRFLAKFKGISVGLCYNNCMQKNLPHGRFDKPVNIIITDKNIERIEKHSI